MTFYNIYISIRIKKVKTLFKNLVEKSYGFLYNKVKVEQNMDEKITLNLKEASPTGSGSLASLNPEKPGELKKKSLGGDRRWLILLICGVVGLIGGIGCFIFVLCNPAEKGDAVSFPDLQQKSDEEKTFSSLTGEELSDSSLKNAPVYCIQTPNGLDGARPQAGITDAGVVFEAIAEAGITRFAAIYQNPKSAIIGPIRSLRLYYLEWDTPFDCTIVHAGGSDEAIVAVSSGGYKNLDENYSYMYRGTFGSRLWNNLFITSANLKRFTDDNGFTTSDIKGFARLTPDESKKARANSQAKEKLNITEPTDKDTSAVAVKVPSVSLRFGGLASFNVNYRYNEKTNTYLRGYESGANHDVYKCPSEDLGKKNPEEVCSLTQVTPSVVVAIVVKESKASDNYHENITTTGSGDAYIFQNGDVIKGTWNKSSKNEQIRFTNSSGEEIRLAPGQTFVSAVPSYGSIEY